MEVSVSVRATHSAKVIRSYPTPTSRPISGDHVLGLELELSLVLEIELELA